MQAFTTHSGLVMPLDRANVDTDAIIPKQFLKSIKRAGFGPYLFDEWRYLDHGEPGQDCTNRPLNKDFVLNQAKYQGASVLLARDNFGCGSSREHAPWALEDHGFRVLIAPSFADIFYNNCFKNGILPIVFNEEIIDKLFDVALSEDGLQVDVDLDNQTLREKNTEFTHNFEVESFRKHCLINGLDDIAISLQKADLIKSYEKQRRQDAPWLFQS